MMRILLIDCSLQYKKKRLCITSGKVWQFNSKAFAYIRLHLSLDTNYKRCLLYLHPHQDEQVWLWKSHFCHVFCVSLLFLYIFYIQCWIIFGFFCFLFFFLLMVIYDYTADLLYLDFSWCFHARSRDKLVEKRQKLFPGFLVLRTMFEKNPQKDSGIRKSITQIQHELFLIWHDF